MHTVMRNIYEEQRSSYLYMNKPPQNKSFFFTDLKLHFKKCALIQKKIVVLKMELNHGNPLRSVCRIFCGQDTTPFKILSTWENKRTTQIEKYTADSGTVSPEIVFNTTGAKIKVMNPLSSLFPRWTFGEYCPKSDRVSAVPLL